MSRSSSKSYIAFLRGVDGPSSYLGLTLSGHIPPVGGLLAGPCPAELLVGAKAIECSVKLLLKIRDSPVERHAHLRDLEIAHSDGAPHLRNFTANRNEEQPPRPHRGKTDFDKLLTRQGLNATPTPSSVDRIRMNTR
jgi:hypothetical protein